MSDLDKDIEIAKVRDDLGRAKNEITKKNQVIDTLEKELREISHNSKQQVSELQMKLDNAQSKIESLEAFSKSLKEATQEDSSSKFIINELEKKTVDLENKIYLLEQSEMNLQRQVHSKNVELGEFKIELEKLKLSSATNSAPSKDQKAKEKEKDSLENLDEETQNLLNSLIQEVEDLKKEKNEFQENALERITEKEMENIELLELLDKQKAEFQKELNEWMIKASDSNLSTYESKKNEFNDDDDNEDEHSLNSEQQAELFEKLKEYETVISELRFELETKAEELDREKSKLLRDHEILETEYKMKMSSLENEVTMLKMEYSRIEIEKLQMQRELTSDTETKDSFYKTIEEYQYKIKNLEENREKTEDRYNSKLNTMKEQLEETENSNKLLKQQYDKIKKELTVLQESSSKKDKEYETVTKKENEYKDKQIKMLNEKIENCNRENNTLKTEYEKYSKTIEKYKQNLLEYQETTRVMRENQTKDIKKWEEKYYDLERKFESEKNNLIENNATLTKQLQSKKTITKMNSTKEADQNVLETVFNQDGEFDDENDQDDDDNPTMLKMKIVSLESQITILNNNITDLKLSIENLTREKILIAKENEKLKISSEESKKLYEKQIGDLQRNSNKLHVERTSLKKSLIGTESMDLNTKQLQLLHELNKTISSLKAENKFLQESNNILNKEKANIQTLRTNDISHYKEEVKKAEQLAVNSKIQFATYVFEKEEEVIKLKQLNKKFMDKLGLTFK